MRRALSNWKTWIGIGILAASMMPLATAAPTATPVIFDTDLGNDVDDALALAMLHAMESRGEVKLLAVTVTKDNEWAPRFASAINLFYGRPDIPVGMVQNGVTKDEGKYNRAAINAGHYRYLNPTGDAVTVLRKALRSQPDHSVVIIQVGFSTNLAHLLAADRALVEQKVKELVLMAGDFDPHGPPEYNVKEDVASATKVVKEWPTPMIWSGYEVGKTVRYPARSIEQDFGWTQHHPVVDAYRLYNKMPYDRETWDLTAVLYAARPDRDYFGLSAAGDVQVDAKGTTLFKRNAKGKHKYMTLTPLQRARTLEAMVELSSQPVGR